MRHTDVPAPLLPHASLLPHGGSRPCCCVSLLSSPPLPQPCASRPLLITELGSEDGGWSATSSTSFDLSDQWDKDGGEVGAPTPLVTLLHGIQRGVGRLALRVGEAFAHLGNFLRRLGDNLKTSL